MAADRPASRRLRAAPEAAAVVRSLGGTAGVTFACPRAARRALVGHTDAAGRQSAVAVLLAVAALARHVPAAPGADLAGRAVPTTLARLGDLALVHGARLDAALHALSAAGLAAWGETAAGLTVELSPGACAPHPALATVPWEVVAGRLAGEGVPRTSAFALFVELALLTEASLGSAAALGPVALGRDAVDARTPRLAPDFAALARELGYHRSRLTPAVKALHEVGLVVWDADPGLRGTVRVAPWALGLAEVPAAGPIGPPVASPPADPAAGPWAAPSASVTGPGVPPAGAAPGMATAQGPAALGAPAGAPQRLLLGGTPVTLPPGTALDFSARTPDGAPALRFSVNGVEVVLPLGGQEPLPGR